MSVLRARHDRATRLMSAVSFPYNGGEEGRPPWWPDEVPHREPDHLSKDQRVRLLMVLLGCGRVPIRNFEAALPEVVTSLKTEKLDIMRDIFKVAKEEERLRILNPSQSCSSCSICAPLADLASQHSDSRLSRSSWPPLDRATRPFPSLASRLLESAGPADWSERPGIGRSERTPAATAPFLRKRLRP